MATRRKPAQPGFRLDLKTVGWLVAFIAGGGVTGVGSSTFLGGDLRAEVTRLSDKVDELTRAVDRKRDTDEIYRSRIEDHEERLRAIEAKRGL